MNRREAKIIALREAVRAIEESAEGDLDYYTDNESDRERIEREILLIRDQLANRLERLDDAR